MGNFHEIGHVRQRRFLNAYTRCGRINKAAEMSGIDTHTHYNWLKTDEQYAGAFIEAQRMAGDLLEDAAVLRAVDGVDKPVYQGGQQVGVVREYSDSLLQFLLKGNKPDKFRDRSDITSNGKELRILIGNSTSDAI